MAKRSGAFLPHEEMMERFNKEGRVSRQEMSLKQIVVDNRLQARERHLDLDNVKALHVVVKDGMRLSPIVVFMIDDVAYVVNGFHRLAVHKKEGLPSILADVVDGTWQEAVEFATCCNLANHALTPTKDDRKKAVFMLFENGWLTRDDEIIASHTGVSVPTVAKYRIEFCGDKGICLPKEVERSDGSRKSIDCPNGLLGFQSEKKNGKTSYFAMNNGEKIILGATQAEARKTLEKLQQSKRFSLASLHPWVIGSIMKAHGISWTSTHDLTLHGVNAGIADDCAIVVLDSIGKGKLFDRSLVAAAIGSVMIVALDPKVCRKVILVPEEFGFWYLYDHVSAAFGIEVMTMQEFAESMRVAKDGVPVAKKAVKRKATVTEMRA